jgi:hypothetical protein
VRYDPDRPANNHPAGSGETSVSLAMFVSFVGVLVGAFGLLIVVALVRMRAVADPPGAS